MWKNKYTACSVGTVLPDLQKSGMQYKVTVKLSLCLIKHRVMKTYREVEVLFHALTLALDGEEWSASRPGLFTHWIGRHYTDWAIQDSWGYNVI